MGLKLEAEVGLNSERFEAGMEKCVDSVKELALAAIGIGTIEKAFDATIKSSLEFGEAIAKSADRLNITAREMQEFQYAMIKSGVDMETFESAIDRLDRAQVEAKNSAGASRDAFYKLGLSLDDIKDKSPTALFDQISAGIAATGTNAQKTAALMDVMGRSAAQLIPSMKDLAENKQTGGLLALSDDQVARLDKAASAFKEVKQNLKTGIAGGVSNLLETVGNWFSGSETLAKVFYGAGDTSFQGGINRQAILDRQRSTALFVANGYSDEIHDYRTPELSEHDKQQKNEVLDIEKEITAEKERGRLAGLTEGQKRIELARQIKDLEYQVLQAPWEGLSDAETAKKKLALAKLQTQQKEANRQVPARVPTDSLITVGNFLGSSRATINSAQARLEKHAATTAQNTTQTVVILNKIVNKLGAPSQMGTDKTDWPTS